MASKHRGQPAHNFDVSLIVPIAGIAVGVAFLVAVVVMVSHG